jgi:hypothetical protein
VEEHYLLLLWVLPPPDPSRSLDGSFFSNLVLLYPLVATSFGDRDHTQTPPNLRANHKVRSEQGQRKLRGRGQVDVRSPNGTVLRDSFHVLQVDTIASSANSSLTGW